MTAQVIIVNQHGVALAADSAVTVGRDRVWNHANKLFSAGPANDIGIMIYNSGSYLGTPWEIVIKEFRRSVGTKQFEKLEDFATDFIGFLNSKNLGNSDREELSFLYLIVDFLDDLKSDMNYKNKAEFYSELSRSLDLLTEKISNESPLPEFMSKKQFVSDFEKTLLGFMKEMFGYVPRRGVFKGLVNVIFDYLGREFESPYFTGVVIAGYGRSELFPVVINYAVDGRYGGFARCWKKSTKNTNLNEDPGGAIIPFAQFDMAFLFMEGIYSPYLSFVAESLSEFLRVKSEELINHYVSDPDARIVENRLQKRKDEDKVSMFLSKFHKFRKDDFVEPVLDTINALPKEEMALMAKSIVELTALRRKVASRIESVGGEIEVAIISKGDGFIWINRKHYFDVELNGDFLYRRKRLREGFCDAPKQLSSDAPGS
jgi:hypothetical protein